MLYPYVANVNCDLHVRAGVYIMYPPACQRHSSQHPMSLWVQAAAKGTSTPAMLTSILT